MKTKSTSLFIAVAAFAVTASGVHAFSSPELLIKAGLTDAQVIAIQEAQELKTIGDVTAAQETLKAAGITKDTMQQIREVAKEAKQAVKEAVSTQDYAAFKVAIIDSPLEDLITTEAEFDQFVEAHAWRQSGDKPAAAEAFAELGIDRSESKSAKRVRAGDRRAVLQEHLTDQQREALQVAQEANDKETVRAIFAEAGIELPVPAKRR